MFNVQVLGSGCSKCEKVVDVLTAYIKENNIEATVTKQTSPEALLQYAVMSTPAIVVNDVVVHSGGIPTKSEVKSWLD